MGHAECEASLTCFTTGNTHGFALLSLYAPMPKSTFFGSSSLRYAAIKPKSGSSAACGTTSTPNAEALAVPLLVDPMCAFTCRNRSLLVFLLWEEDEDVLVDISTVEAFKLRKFECGEIATLGHARGTVAEEPSAVVRDSLVCERGLVEMDNNKKEAVKWNATEHVFSAEVEVMSTRAQ